MAQRDDIWYAVNTTRVIHSPEQMLETFGTTTIRYHLISELMDEVNQVRVRAGSLYSERPQIITPSHIASQLLDGFGEKAREYAEWLHSNGEIIRILKYGLHFRKEKMDEKLLTGPINEIAEKVRGEVLNNNETFSAVVIGADELWEVSLLKFVVDYIQQSAPANLQDLSTRALSPTASSTPAREEIEADFGAASMDPKRIDSLGKKLQKYGLFEEYEDRFYALVRTM